MDGRRVALYLRVSTVNGQTTENQRRELAAWAKRARWPVVTVFEDAGISGAKGRDKRPGLDAALKAATRREYDVLAAWSVDRLGRSLVDLLETLQELHAAGADLYLHQQAVDTTTPAGRALFSMLGVFAEFERAVIRERITAGQARARAQGKHLGRPRIEGEGVAVARSALAAGASLHQAMRASGVTMAVVRRVRSELQAARNNPGEPPY